MEVIGSVASIGQIISQAIAVVRTVQEAQAQVHDARDSVGRHNEQLDKLLDTLRLVQNEKDLHTSSVQESVQEIRDVAAELKTKLDVLVRRLSRSKSNQFIHALARGGKDEKVDIIWSRLDRAKADLMSRIAVVHVGISGSLRDGFTAAMPVIQRVDQNTQKVLNTRLAVAEQLDGRDSGSENAGQVPLTKEDIQTLGVVDKVQWIENKSYGNSDMFNMDLTGFQGPGTVDRVYHGNESHANSFSFQGRGSGEDVATMIKARRG